LLPYNKYAVQYRAEFITHYVLLLEKDTVICIEAAPEHWDVLLETIPVSEVIPRSYVLHALCLLL
jgi:hypothetical protein